MDQATHNKIVSFIWGVADDVLRDLFVRGKYRDVILPMCVLRRLDAVLEPSKKAVLETKEMLDKAGITEQRAALCGASGQAFYNTSKFTLRDLKARASQQKLEADFRDYLDGFSSNVQDILTNFEFRNIIPRLSKADALGTMIAKFLDSEINLSPNPVLNGDNTVKHPAMDNHSMGTVFEELVRKFNEENNEAPDTGSSPAGGFMATEAQKQELKEKIGDLVRSKFGGDYHQAFDHYDSDVKDGKITRDELMKLLGDADIGNWLTRGAWADGIIAELDTDKDGCISAAEFEVVLKE